MGRIARASIGFFVLLALMLVLPTIHESAQSSSGLKGKVAFCDDDRLFVATIENGKVTGKKQYTTGKYGCSDPCFDKDGMTIACFGYDKDKLSQGPDDGVHFRQYSGILFVDVQTGKVDWRPLHGGLSGTNWISKDILIGGAPLSSDIWQYNRKTGKRTVFLSIPPGTLRGDYYYYYSADPKTQTALIASVDRREGGKQVDIFKRGLDGKRTDIATDIDQDINSISWCAGKDVAAFTTEAANEGVWMTAVNRWNPEPLANAPAGPIKRTYSFTPDGNCVLVSDAGQSQYSNPAFSCCYTDSGESEFLGLNGEGISWDPSYPGTGSGSGHSDVEGKLSSSQVSCYGFDYGDGIVTKALMEDAADRLRRDGYVNSESYDNVNPDKAKSRLPDDSVFFFAGHGGSGYGKWVKFAEGAPSAHNYLFLKALPTDEKTGPSIDDLNLAGVDLMVFWGCNTGKGWQESNTLLNVSSDRGAGAVIGFTAYLSMGKDPQWIEKFLILALEDHLSISDAAFRAANEVNDSWYEPLWPNHGWHGLSPATTVVMGNGINDTLRPE